MLLKNYDHILTYIAGAGNADASGENTKIRTTNGSELSVNLSYARLNLTSTNICIGNGTQEVDYADYKMMGGVLGTSFTSVSSTTAFDDETNQWVRTIVVKYANTSDEDFVVSEWGIWTPANAYSGNTHTYSNSCSVCCLLYRELLAKPVTIAGNSTATLTFALRIPHEINAF